VAAAMEREEEKIIVQSTDGDSNFIGISKATVQHSKWRTVFAVDY